MKKKIISVLIILCTILGIIFSVSLYAGTGKLYTNLAANNLDGVGYGIGDPTKGAPNKYIWHMNTFDSTDGVPSDVQKNLYCLRGDYGDSWGSVSNGITSILEYNMVFNLQEDEENDDKNDLLQKIIDDGKDSYDIITALLNENGNQYTKILWLLDNMYIKDETDKTDFLEKAGIIKNEAYGLYTTKDGNVIGSEILTDEDIIAIQRVAIWTITNGGNFDKTEASQWLNIKQADGSYIDLFSVSKSRNDMANYLYKYLVNGAASGASLYTSTNGYKMSELPVEVNISDLTIENGKYKINAEITDSDYIVGPIIIDQNNDFLYKISMTVTDENGTEIKSSNYTFTDSTGTSLGNVTLKSLVGKSEGFYIKVNRDLAQKINIDIQTTHYNTTKNLWLVGNDTGSQITLNSEQPVGEITREEVLTPFSFVAEPEFTEVTVTKNWDDENNQDGKRPESVTVQLLANEIITGETLTLNESNGWTGTFENLPKRFNGTEVVYTVEENPVPAAYSLAEISEDDTAEHAFTITNKHTPETIDISGSKTWNDENNQDGKRPTSITINLLADGTKVDSKTVTDADGWAWSFEGKAKYADGKEIRYTITEEAVAGYTTEVNGYDVTNTYTPETIDISGSKTWNDGNNQDGKRPTSITINLLADGTKVDSKTVTDADGWAWSFTGLAKYEDGEEIEYTITEDEVAEYTTEVNGYDVTNTYAPETIDISGSKTWNDAGNQDGKRPTSITINLLADGTKVDSQTVTEADNWEWSFEGKAKYANGKEITYTITEDPVPGYTTTVSGYNVINSYTPGVTSVKVKKVWDDNNDQDGLRSESVTVSLLKNGELHDSVVLSAENNWQHIFPDLPEKENGQDITYTVAEITQIEGYTTTITNDNLTSESGEIQTASAPEFTITNTHEIEKIFDLALRKYITKINNNEITTLGLSTRVPQINKETIGSQGTATYNHRKDPLQVQTGDIVTYSITIYNEGEKPGYATQIIDQLPTGLKSKYKTGDVVTSTDAQGVRNTYTVTYDETKNILTFDIVNSTDDVAQELQAYTSENLDNETIEIECEVIAVASKEGSQVLTNVAWINGAFDTEDGKNITQKGDDRDSLPTEKPDVDKDSMEDYKGNTNNTADLTENTYHYGEQDDDDFEKLIIPAAKKEFDLALRKYIIKINNNELPALGLSTRVPNISETTLQNGKTATYRHRKDPVEVEEGDIVTYAITIYNEGEKAGYATQIIDQLPEGLTYNQDNVEITSSQNNKYSLSKSEWSKNKIVLDIINDGENPITELQSYKAGNLDSETIEIKCKVTHRAKAGEKNILTNVAWINEAYDSEDNKTITTTVGEDRDSEPKTIPVVDKDNIEDFRGNIKNNADLSENIYHYGEQDDDDFEKLYVKMFDLSLRKFITSISGKETDISREPQVDVAPLKNGETTAIYNHPKTPVALKVGDTVIYTIRVYNEGEIAGYASEVKDYLPPYLEYVENSTINSKYGWKISEDGRVATTTCLSDKEIIAFDGTELDSEDLQIECKISANAIPDERITNIAEISEYKYDDTIVKEDIDSESNNMTDEDTNYMPEDKDLPNYKKDKEKDLYVPGNEDDDDFEKVYVKEFDLALRKFITEVQGKEIATRIPQVKNENGVLSYEHPKDPLTVHVGERVIYTLRIYNEGEIAGYASEISDDIPEYLEYLPEDSTNVEYMWKMYNENGNETENIEEAVKIKTEYLSKENGKDNLLEAYDGNTLYYRDVKIAFKVKDPNSNTYIITNYAQISDDTDEDGKDIKDKDSTPDEWIDNDKHKDDDQDIENVKVEYFDLSILKFVSKVIVQEEGKETITETGYDGHEDPEPVVKVELHKKKLKDVIVKFGYGITITNEGDIPGYATELTDYVPQGLKFDPTDNPEWTDEGNNVISTRQLEDTLLQPGESKTVEVIFTWINDPNNLAQKTNTVEISEDSNEYDVPDRDSTPDNKVNGEDDIDIAKVILAISTGRTKTYFTLTLGLLGVVLVGVALIKKFVI